MGPQRGVMGWHPLCSYTERRRRKEEEEEVVVVVVVVEKHESEGRIRDSLLPWREMYGSRWFMA